MVGGNRMERTHVGECHEGASGVAHREWGWLMRRRLTAIALVALILLSVFHFLIVVVNAVDVPVSDEWSLIRRWADDGAWRWIPRFHNDHRIVPTKLQMLLLYSVNGWNTSTHVALNFVLFLTLVGSVISLGRKLLTRSETFWLYVASMFMLSPLNWADHVSPLQGAFYFVGLFTILAVFCLFSEQQRLSSLALGVVFAWAAMFSLAAGLAACAAIMVAYGLFKAQRWYSCTSDRCANMEIAQWFAVTTATSVGFGLWFVGYQAPNQAYAIDVWTAQYLGKFLSFISYGFGFRTSESVALGLISLALLAFPVLSVLAGGDGQVRKDLAPLVALMFAIVAMIASIVYGRGNFEGAPLKAYRYAPIPMLLTPLTVIAWCVWARGRKWLKWVLPAVLIAFIAYGYSDEWDFSRYSRAAALRREGLRCIEQYYLDGTLCDHSIIRLHDARSLEAARCLNLSFYRKLVERQSIVSGFHSLETPIFRDGFDSADTSRWGGLPSGEERTP